MDTTITADREPLSKADADLIVSKLVSLRETTGSDIMKLASPSIVRQALIPMSQRGQIVSFRKEGKLMGIVVFDAGYQWWSDKLILTELLVLSIDKSLQGFGRLAADTLHHLAKLYECQAIVAGCLFNKNSQVVTNTYKKKGFSTAPAYVKVLEG